MNNMSYYGPSAKLTFLSQSSKRKRSASSGIYVEEDPKTPSQSIDLTIYGHPCKLYRDDLEAIFFDQGKHLINMLESIEEDMDSFHDDISNDVLHTSSDHHNHDDDKSTPRFNPNYDNLFVDRYDVRMHMDSSELQGKCSFRNQAKSIHLRNYDSDLTTEQSYNLQLERYLDLPICDLTNTAFDDGKLTERQQHLPDSIDPIDPSQSFAHSKQVGDLKQDGNSKNRITTATNMPDSEIGEEEMIPFEFNEFEKEMLPKTIVLVCLSHVYFSYRKPIS